MDGRALPVEYAKWDPEEAAKAQLFLEILQSLRTEAAAVTPPSAEFFDPSFAPDWSSRKTVERKVKYFSQMSYMHAIIMRHEFALKLLCSVDGYLEAAQSGNPLMTYLSARYLLELTATVNAITGDLAKAKDADLRDLEGRGSRFLIALLRSRYSSSDPKVTEPLRKFGLPKSAAEPIKIVNAIKELSCVENFGSAINDYDFLSNVCHHNGSGHRLFHRGFRKTVHVVPPSGPAIHKRTPDIAVTLEYPSKIASRAATIQTAGLAYHCAAHVLELLAHLPLVPFTDDEVEKVTRGGLRDPLQYTPIRTQNERDRFMAMNTEKIGRNDPCPCGSGKKFKACCAPLVR